MAEDGFEAIYREGLPPWDIGRPQPAFEELEEAGKIGHEVLDAGCGTGELVLYLAERGHTAYGIDGSPTALAKARSKAKERGLHAEFVHLDALRLPGLRRTFDSVTDCGLFHVFTDEERVEYERGLREVVRPGGTYHVLCFSDAEPPGWGPRRVSEHELRATFGDGWKVEEIVPRLFRSRLGPEGAKAWRATFTRAK